MLRSLVVCALVLLAGAPVLADGGAGFCLGPTIEPMDGATNVDPSVVIAIRTGCDNTEPWLEGPGGVVVGLDLTRWEGSSYMEARPRQVLTPGIWKVHLGVIICCAPTQDAASSFEVGGVPKLLDVYFDVGAGQGLDCLDAIKIALSEPPAEAAVPYLEASLAPTEETSTPSRGFVVLSYRHLSPGQRPRASQPFTLRIRKELPFVSGARLPEDLEVTYTPPPRKSGCSTAGGTALPGLLGILAFLHRSRRCLRG
ncbi:MAG TPA: hypothetical protein VGK67_39305 [Myxococcales bacterium]